MRGVALAELAMSAAPWHVSGYRTRVELLPSFVPSCPKWRAFPSPPTSKPKLRGPACAVAIRLASAGLSKALGSSRTASIAAKPKLARSHAVLHKLAAARSGYTCQQPGTIVPSAPWHEATLSLAEGSSHPIPVLRNGARPP